MTVFRSDRDRNDYLRFIRKETARFGVEVLAWCLMTNHVHFIAVPSQQTALARAFGEAHRRFTYARNREENTRGYLFQGRFGSCILDEDHLLAAVRYVELNPVRAGMVEKAWEYPWSSARFHVGLHETDLLVKSRSLMGLSIDWRGFLLTEDPAMREKVRKATQTGRPAGDDTFMESIEQVTCRNLRYGKRGRPRKEPEN
ncbi:MAG: transposase [Alphaproteobacteria bacterium]|uniref:Transposase n=1 Tax=Candidatus Nitrobium versatile TaxID=2884831 RepID=A0A953JB42_9BACT|nr:transposase [Candidatus Nitrobium versatile]